jgi:hypothetical protein
MQGSSSILDVDDGILVRAPGADLIRNDLDVISIEGDPYCEPNRPRRAGHATAPRGVARTMAARAVYDIKNAPSVSMGR